MPGKQPLGLYFAAEKHRRDVPANVLKNGAPGTISNVWPPAKEN